MYSERIESLIEAILADGEIEESELRVLKKAAQREGEDPEEVEIVVRGRLAKMQKSQSVGVAVPSNVPDAKQGNVMRCPNCGAEVVGGKAFCPECGYNFTNVKANSSAEKLAQKLQELSEKNGGPGLLSGLNSMLGKAYSGKKSPEAVCIENFPVPNTREDLLEFLTSIQPKAKKLNFFTKQKMEYEIPGAYWALYSNCINKARISFKNDPDFQFFFEDYNNR